MEASAASENVSLYLLHSGQSENTRRRVSTLTSAASARNIDVHTIDTLLADYTSLPRLRAGDLLFNVGRGGGMLETLLTHSMVISFRRREYCRVDNDGDTTVFTALHEREGLPGPKTFFGLPADPAGIARAIDLLEGPPVVVKTRGGSVGLGVMVCPNLEAIFSVVEYIREKGDGFIVREFIHHDEVARIFVLGGKVICSCAKPIRANDFRSSVDTKTFRIKTFGSEVESLAIQACNLQDTDFAGVDIIDHPERGPLLLESNSPCDFGYLEQFEFPIGEVLVDFLLTKRSKLMKDSQN